MRSVLALALVASSIATTAPAALYTYSLMGVIEGFLINSEPYGEPAPLYLAEPQDGSGPSEHFRFDLAFDPAGQTIDMDGLTSDGYDLSGWITFGDLLPTAWEFEGYDGNQGQHHSSAGYPWSWHDQVSNPEVLPAAGTPLHSLFYSPPDNWLIITALGHWQQTTISTVPIPASLGLLLSGLAGLVWLRRKIRLSPR